MTVGLIICFLSIVTDSHADAFIIGFEHPKARSRAAQ